MMGSKKNGLSKEERKKLREQEKLRRKEEKQRKKAEKLKKKMTPPKYIYNVLKEGEKVMFAFKENFFLALVPGFNIIPPWVIVTNYRIIYLDPKFPNGYDFIGFPWEEITFLKFSRGLFFGTFEVMDEKGNSRKINWLSNPEPFFELKQYCIERIQSIAIENPTVKENVWIVWKSFEIQRSPESSGRIKMQMVNSTTEGMPQNLAIGPTKVEQNVNMPNLDFSQAMKIVNMEAELPSDKIIVAGKMLKEGMINEETYNQIIRAITEESPQETQEETSAEE